MNTLVVRDCSEVANEIVKVANTLGTCTETTLDMVDTVKGSGFNSIVISSHQFAYDRDMNNRDLINYYKTDLIAFCNLLDNAENYLQQGGKIIVILSMDYTIGSYASKHYNALHAARSSLIQSYGNTLGKDNISINGIALGWIEDVLEASTDENTRTIMNVAKRFNPYSRMGSLREVAEFVKGLLLVKTNFLNGHIINFDGGQINADPVNMREWELLT